ncbi:MULTISPECIES: MOSC domain-containing protein [unclassified Brachybacterium]|uniref:MOSC domain-containing protein n=1 Tax=unclassified Brachybacterium TaxID=2623841 RepID=UPI003621372E
MSPTVESVHLSAAHTFSKTPVPEIQLLEGVGVAGDAHSGRTVKHRSRVARDPDQPNLRQVHLIHAELLEQLAAEGHHVAPGQLGENITTAGIDLLSLPVGTRLHVAEAIIEVTGLRNPCWQIDAFQPGLLKQVVRKDESGQVHKLAGVMGVVACGGTVRPGEGIRVELPAEPHRRLAGV